MPVVALRGRVSPACSQRGACRRQVDASTFYSNLLHVCDWLMGPRCCKMERLGHCTSCPTPSPPNGLCAGALNCSQDWWKKLTMPLRRAVMFLIVGPRLRSCQAPAHTYGTTALGKSVHSPHPLMLLTFPGRIMDDVKCAGDINMDFQSNQACISQLLPTR